MKSKDKTIGNALDFVQARFGKFDFANLLPHLKSFSGKELNAIVAQECGEELVKIYPTSKILILGNSPASREPFFRKRAWEQLQEASHFLPLGLAFGLVEVFRSKERQLKLREGRFDLLRVKRPELVDGEIWKIVNTFIAGPGGPHQTGAAVDICLVDLNTRKPLDMGSPSHGIDRRSYTASNMVSLEAQVHRYILATIMTYFGFRNYPAEWWHYEYGTKRHSKYLRFEECMYDVVDLAA
jgi:zinc D-Ala-D-Ala dipeptidase